MMSNQRYQELRHLFSQVCKGNYVLSCTIVHVDNLSISIADDEEARKVFSEALYTKATVDYTIDKEWLSLRMNGGHVVPDSFDKELTKAMRGIEPLPMQKPDGTIEIGTIKSVPSGLDCIVRIMPKQEEDKGNE
jgi:hypothetical protein